MSFTVTKVDIWTSKIEDKPGGLAKVLGALGNAGGSLDCVIARRDPSKPGAGLCFLRRQRELLSEKLRNQ